ncbi:MAG: TetR/AcrR family transcriptional regulator [Bacteroidetes bacterium]|nr:TetR/AcrR family transcriptional regulator [Bacteroidota bacterium]
MTKKKDTFKKLNKETTTIEHSTEQAILKAAKKVFIRKGMEGARMQEIADEAGMNKALLHYYFRTKDNLFEGIFIEAFQKLVPNILELFDSDLPLFEKIEMFAGKYIETFIENPMVPGFIMHELSRDPDKIVNVIRNIGIKPQVFVKQIEKEIEKGAIIPVDPYHLIVNMLAMCIFPFVAKPILMNVLFDQNPEKFSQFIQQRKKEVPEFIINAIRKK